MACRAAWRHFHAADGRRWPHHEVERSSPQESAGLLCATWAAFTRRATCVAPSTHASWITETIAWRPSLALVIVGPRGPKSDCGPHVPGGPCDPSSRRPQATGQADHMGLGPQATGRAAQVWASLQLREPTWTLRAVHLEQHPVVKASALCACVSADEAATLLDLLGPRGGSRPMTEGSLGQLGVNTANLGNMNRTRGVADPSPLRHLARPMAVWPPCSAQSSLASIAHPPRARWRLGAAQRGHHRAVVLADARDICGRAILPQPAARPACGAHGARRGGAASRGV